MDAARPHNGINQALQQQLNLSLILRMLWKEGTCSRATLSRLSGLQRPTISNIIRDCIQCGLVVEQGLMEGEKGRRSIGIAINGDRYRVIAVKVSRRVCSVMLMGLSGECYEKECFPITQQEDATTTISNLRTHIAQIIDRNPQCQVLAVGMTVPGPFKRENEEIIFVTNLVGWEGVHLMEELKKLGNIPVFVGNDANAAASACLWKSGNQPGTADLVYIIAGYGIGSGIVSHGRLLTGSLGIAGEIGHTSICYDGPKCECGNRGCLECYCSALVLERNLQSRLNAGESSVLEAVSGHLTWEAIQAAIRGGDEMATREFVQVCRYLAVGIVNLINQYNPSKVVVGDLLAQLAPDLLLDTVRTHVCSLVRPSIWENLTIELDSMEEDPILLGAGLLAVEQVLERPAAFIPDMPR